MQSPYTSWKKSIFKEKLWLCSALADKREKISGAVALLTLRQMVTKK